MQGQSQSLLDALRVPQPQLLSKSRGKQRKEGKVQSCLLSARSGGWGGHAESGFPTSREQEAWQLLCSDRALLSKIYSNLKRYFQKTDF